MPSATALQAAASATGSTPASASQPIVIAYLAAFLLVRRSWRLQAPVGAAIGPYGPLFQTIAVLVVEWRILYWMYKRKSFLTA